MIQIIQQIIQLIAQYLSQKTMAPVSTVEGPLSPIQALRKVYAENGATMDPVSILGARNDSSPGEWNDFFIVCVGDKIMKLKGTTDPGKKYTLTPLNSAGCANVCLGFHEKIWEHGLHRGQDALRQCGSIRIWRDADRDHVFSQNDPVQYAGPESGINYHRGGMTQNVGGWSAGCQVPQDPDLYQRHLDVINTVEQKQFSYLLVQMASLPKQLRDLPYWK